MKKIFYFVLFTFAFKAYSQEIKMNKAELGKLLCKSWKFDSAVSNGKKIAMPASSNTGILFKPDNTFREKPKTSFGDGKWNYNLKKHCVELFEDGKLIGTVKSISSKELIYLPAPGKNVKSSEIHLKPAK